MVQLLTPLNRVKERGNDLTQQAVERGGELLERGNGPASRWAKLAGARLT
ncbi:MAG: hypothetical protein JO287_03275, partial [Pseudonocardiales bacterium]|nr:hypothetical protein [Pseudonocardiales bacterium]